MKYKIWSSLVVMTLFAALAIPAQARIVYTPVNVTLPTNSYYPIDLNHDGITDFKFYLFLGHIICPPPLEHSYLVKLTIQPTSGRGGIVGGSDAAALQSGVQIDSHQGFYQYIALMYSVFFGGCNFQVGQWYRVPPRYLGLEFQINGQTHYGWAELSTNNGNLLYGFAYETIPGMAIKTGQIFDSPDEPGIGPDSAESEDSGPTASVVPPLSAAPKLQSSGYTNAAIPIGMAVQDQQHQKQQPRYTVTDLGTLGGTFVVAESITNSGWVDGFSTLAGDQSERAFLWRNGVMIDLGTLGGPNSVAAFPPNERVEVGGVAETLTPDPLGEDFCGFGDHLVCLPFLWQDGVMSPLPTLGGSNGTSKEVNNRGQIVGAAENSTFDPTCTPPQVLDIVPLIWEPKQGKFKITQLPLLPGDTTGFALAINDNGQTVGIAGSCIDFYVHAVLWQNGAVTDLGNLGGTDGNVPLDINNQGHVVGFSDLPGDMTDHAFLWQNGVMTDLGTLPGDFASNGNSINSKGQVVGTSYDASGNSRAFFWQRGVMTDLNTLIPIGSPLFLLDGNGINSSGEIVGDALQVSTGEVHAYLATPCDQRRKDKEDCEDGAEGTTAAGGATSERPKVTLPENVRNLLRQQLARRYRISGQPAPPRD